MLSASSLRHRVGFMGAIVVAPGFADRRGRKFSPKDNEP
jgi:hypothetical protein